MTQCDCHIRFLSGRTTREGFACDTIVGIIDSSDIIEACITCESLRHLPTQLSQCCKTKCRMKGLRKRLDDGYQHSFMQGCLNSRLHVPYDNEHDEDLSISNESLDVLLLGCYACVQVCQDSGGWRGDGEVTEQLCECVGCGL